MKKLIIVIALIIGLSACLDPPDYPSEPQIEFESLSRSQINSQDTLTISFTFKDGDGDIGFENLEATPGLNPCDTNLTENENLNLFMLDNRTGCYLPFNTPFIPKKGSYNAIKGTVRISIGGTTTCCDPPDAVRCQPAPDYPMDTVRYTILLKDRAGNLSNEIETPPIYIKCAE